MLAAHRALGTWTRNVDVFIAPSEICRRKLVEGGLPEAKILVKPHFVHPDPGQREGTGEYALFVGRLSPEKGVRPLLRAWQRLRDVPLAIVGDGPLLSEVEAAAGATGSIRVLGWRAASDVARIVRRARFLVFPSLWLEPFGRTIIEAFACGVPVLASPLGAAAELVRDGETGLHFRADEPTDIADKAAWLWARPAAAEAMGRRARGEFVEKYGAEANLRRLLEIYEVAAERGGGRIGW
jgi:glycosyltransferase involved in cell wall biosynthesis